MIRRIIEEYDIKHTGDEMNRVEILQAFRSLAKLCVCSAEVTVSSEKNDLICVTIETVNVP